MIRATIFVLFWGLIGLDTFAQKFSQQEIPDSILARIEGKSFKDNCTTPREDLRYLRLSH